MYINKKLHTSSRFARLKAVSKLSTFFDTPCIINWIANFLTDRTQKRVIVNGIETNYVIVNEIETNYVHINKGVPEAQS